MKPKPPDARGLAADEDRTRSRRRALKILALGWLAVAALSSVFALRNLSVPGLNYDEAIYGHAAKSFLTNHHDRLLPASRTVSLFGRPFPLFLQAYLGALMSWMVMPGLALFGFTTAVMRLTTWIWALAALLFLMLWLRRLLGGGAPVLTGLLLSLDPSFLFISVCVWGPVVPSFLCRFAGFYFAVKWWQERRRRDLFLAGLVLGAGVFNKIDFVVILLGCGVAVVAVYRVEMWDALRRRPAHAGWGALGFLLGAGAAAWNVPVIARSLLAGGGSQPSEVMEKAGAFRTMFDGSYFYRLMAEGGHFDRMFSTSVPVWGPFGLIFALAFAFLGFTVLRDARRGAPDRTAAFLLLSTVLVLLAIWFLPGAVRIHHWTLVFPLPHVVVAAAAVRLWRERRAVPRALASLAVAAVLCGHLITLGATQRLIAETGGRGLWSNALDAFAAEVRARGDLTIVSYDWGFYEQLAFLTDRPRLLEPIWLELPANRFIVPTAPNVIHLIHPPDVQVFPLSGALLRQVRATDPKKVSVRAYNDRTGRTAFYAIRFLGG
jgi:hypothetical protein